MKIYEDNGTFHISNHSVIHDTLPVGNYVVRKNPMSGAFYLEKRSNYVLPSKIYGDTNTLCKRYLKAFNNKTENLGILLNGQKGSGKTLLAKMICLESGLPYISIEEKFKGPSFISFMNNIEQECVIFIDEFDKIYGGRLHSEIDDEGGGGSNQLELLRIMDGGLQSKKIFIFTSNELTVSEYMVNRPSRIRYKQNFDRLSPEIVREVAVDKLEDQSKVDALVELSISYFGFNLDTLLILIEEINLFDEEPKHVIKFMNIEPESDKYKLTYVTKENISFEYAGYWYQIPSVDNVPRQYDFSRNSEGKELKEYDSDMNNYNHKLEKGNIVFTHKTNGSKLICTPVFTNRYAF